MAAPKGHPPYPGCEKGAEHGKKGGAPKIWTDEAIQAAADSLHEYLDNVVEKKTGFFWWKDWCFEYGILPSKASELSKEHNGFREAYNRANEMQEQLVIKGALVKKLADNFSQFYLKHRHRENWTPPSDASENGANLVSLLKLYREGKLTGDDIGKLIGDVVK